MHIEDRQVINVQREELWDFLMQVENAAECIPGCDGVRPTGTDEYDTSMKVRVGAIRLKLEGRLRVVERDRENWTATMKVEGIERHVGGGANVTVTMTLVEQSPGVTELLVKTDAKILGKLGEFGQPVMKKKAAAITEQFARTISERIGQDGGARARPGQSGR